MSVGVLAHLFGSMPYRELAKKVGEAGFGHVQLALWKAFNDYDFSKPGKLSPGLALSIAEQFAKNGVSISVLGCYLHFLERDREKLRENVERFKELIRYARFLNAPIVAAETGGFADGNYTKEDRAVLKSVLEELVEEAEKWGVFVGLEPANGHFIATAQELREWLDIVPSTQIGVVMDPGNLLHEGNFDRQDEVIREAFQLLGPHIIACHAKDRKWSEDGRVVTVPAGLGEMNYALYMKLLHEYKPGAHIVMETAREDQMADCKAFIEKMMKLAEG